MTEWIEKKVSVGSLITLAGILFATAGFYYTTNISIANQDRVQQQQQKAIEALFEENKRFFTEIQRVQGVEQNARENIRQEMIARSDRAGENQIKTIERMVAVETEIKGLRSDIARILDRIDGRSRPN